jgi:hypothetical protein
LEAALVFVDVFALVPFYGAEVQDFLAADFADAAGASAEAVDEPGEFVEGGGLEDGYAAVGAGGPIFRRCEFRRRFRFRCAGFQRFCLRALAR